MGVGGNGLWGMDSGSEVSIILAKLNALAYLRLQMTSRLLQPRSFLRFLDFEQDTRLNANFIFHVSENSQSTVVTYNKSLPVCTDVKFEKKETMRSQAQSPALPRLGSP